MRHDGLGALLALGAALALTVACSEARNLAEPDAAATPADARAQLQAKARAAALTADAAVDQRPAFTQQTVLKLNAVVSRTKAALDRFDLLTPQLAAARAAGDKARIAALTGEIGKLEAEARAARTAFAAEKAALLASDEYHDERILAAMEQFVTDAPDEIGQAIAAAAQ